MLQQRLTCLLQGFSVVYPKTPHLASLTKSFKASDLQVHLREQQLQPPVFSPETLTFGKYHCDHMLTINYDNVQGWSHPHIHPFQPLHLHPFSSCLHYGIQCFEGLKAYRNQKGQIRLFRPECNVLRLKRSSRRLTLPDFDGYQFLYLMEQYVKMEEKWIPPISEFSLYIRPFHLGMDQTLGVKSPDKSKLMITAGPVGPYYPTGFKPISLCCIEDAIRSAPKGTGSFKLGGNYGPTILASTQVAARGHQQVLWLNNDEVNQVGSSNIFFVFKDKSGQIEVATPELQDLILPGITRDSIIELLKSEGQYKISVRKIHMSEVVERHGRGELMECFGAGTAVLVSAVNNIEYKGHSYPIPVDEKLHIGPISYQIRQKIMGIQEGRIPDKFGWIKKLK